MEEEKIKKIYEILNNIPVTEDNKKTIEEIKRELLNKDYLEAFKRRGRRGNISKRIK